jgi:co-chaperonin GroES (HSP10)
MDNKERPDVSREKYKLDSIEGLKWIETSNRVLCRVVDKNIEQRTKSGIYISPVVLHQGRGEHADRLYEVRWVPPKLYHSKDIRDHHKKRGIYFKSMEWDCDVEVEPGDFVFVKAKETWNCPLFQVNGDEYSLLHYGALVVAWKRSCGLNYSNKKRKYMVKHDAVFLKEPQMLNGYILVEEVQEDSIGKYGIILLNQVQRKADYRYGIVRFIGKPNKGYFRCKNSGDNKVPFITRDGVRYLSKEVFSDEGCDIKVGDKVLRASDTKPVFLESSVHQKFDKDKNYFVLQRWEIIAKVIE